MERKFKRFHHLTYTDRLKIEQMYNGGAGIQEIADALRVNYTTVYRELKRPGVMYDHLNGATPPTSRNNSMNTERPPRADRSSWGMTMRWRTTLSARSLTRGAAPLLS